MLHELGQPAVLADGGGDLQAAREGVHAADVRVEQVHRLEALAPHLGVEVRAAGLEAAHVEDGQHDLGRQINVGRELVGVPAQQHVAGVGVDRAERAGGDGHFQLVLHGVAGQRGVVGLEVQLEVAQQVVFAQEVQARRGVGIVLVLGRLLGLGLDVELALEADGLLVVHRQVQELAPGGPARASGRCSSSVL